MSIAGLGGLPQLSLPLARVEAGPVGLSLVAARGQDEQLLDLVAGRLGALLRRS
jgi:amidase